ncbi:hypothetical protein [Prevotella nigrescens]|jgi:hypothetical protein|uniref:hypothetical protein n=1 Tax=Prevotella nigrescens TaxID=28133 RepID=UPI0002AEB368|nr:hypothetical protein [Prevotella nigrescens]ELX68419.1 hypothetical protein HMPREF0662_00167 [Prevotella nigrescens F0103]MBF1452474.1 hypothetical protein [Prevotella nigrescens]MBF1456090.1 hypothetical protein [Prevotella nigrescens]MBW4726002.1 hypothetical protein [Prevotella nigrescens]QUB53669.1 hypothetical protein J4865_08735 [Prevotella nigrescens F0103]
MNIILIGILAIVGMGVIVGASTLISRHNSTEPDVVAPAAGDCATCSGINDDCEQTCMMEAATKEVEYYDDEELDRFKGKESGEYTDDEAEEFSEVLYTMRPDEAKGWNRSLILRGINVPNQIKDDLITMIEG